VADGFVHDFGGDFDREIAARFVDVDEFGFHWAIYL
jgi:hypothetical protein